MAVEGLSHNTGERTGTGAACEIFNRQLWFLPEKAAKPGSFPKFLSEGRDFMPLNNNLTSEGYPSPGPVPYFPQIFNPAPPPVQQPAVVQIVPPEVFYCLKDSGEQNLRLAVKAEQLEQRLQMKTLKEEAYINARAENQRTWTMTESGRPVELLDAALTAAFRLAPQGPEKHPVSYGLEFTGQEHLIILDEPS